MEISVADFSVPIEASVFNFCVHLQVGYVYCVNENKDAKALSLLYNKYVHFQIGKVYCVNES